jgi:WD40 repeat protein
MEKVAGRLGLFVLVIMCVLAPGRFVHADVEWTIVKQIDLKARPLDISLSPDGRRLFILVPGEILLYSTSDGTVTERIPTDKSFDRLTYSPGDDSLILTSSSAKTLNIIRLEFSHRISISGLPFLGPDDAPVTVAVFSDYQ